MYLISLFAFLMEVPPQIGLSHWLFIGGREPEPLQEARMMGISLPPGGLHYAGSIVGHGIVLSKENTDVYPYWRKLTNITVKNVRVENCEYGISVSLTTENCKIENCSVIGNTVVGIFLHGINSTASKCTVTGNVGHGIYSLNHGNIIENNNVINNGMCGIVAVYVKDNYIVNNRIVGNKQHGIMIGTLHTKHIVAHNFVAENLLNGITIFKSSQNDLYNNTITALLHI